MNPVIVELTAGETSAEDAVAALIGADVHGRPAVDRVMIAGRMLGLHLILIKFPAAVVPPGAAKRKLPAGRAEDARSLGNVQV